MPLKNLLPQALLLLGVTSFSVQAQTAFPVGRNIVIAKPGTNSAAKVYTIYTNTSAASATFTAGVTFTPLYNINGIGLSTIDNLVYGSAFTGNSNNIATAFNVSLFRIGFDGALVDLGLLPLTGAAGSGTLEFVNFSAGTVATDGKFYYTTYAIIPSAVARITNRISNGLLPDLTAADLKIYVCWKSDVHLLPANPGGALASPTGYYEVNFSNPDITAGINAFLAQVNMFYPNVYDADGGIQDFAINPVDGKIYGYISYPLGPNLVGRAVSLSAPVANISIATPVGTVVNSVPGQEAAGVQFDLTGNMYTLFTTGGYSQVNLTTGALTGIVASNIATSGGNLRGDVASALVVTPLPIEVISFTGKNTGAVNEFNWVTASEQNNRNFTLERSMDQRTWTSIGTVNTKAPEGNSKEKLNYSFIDQTPLTGTAYYRLKQSDRDDKVTYSTVISIASGTDRAISIYPNPTGELIQIHGLSVGNTVRVFDMTGKVVLTQKATQKSVTVNLAGLPTNIYMIQVADNSNILYTGRVSKK